MTPFPAVAPNATTAAISDVDLMAVIAWLDGQPKPTTGPGLYADFCGNCHGPTMGTGGAVPISIVGKMKTQISQKVRVGEGTDPAMRNGFMPPEDMTALTEPELDLIKAYLMGI
jgi:mono/diheme cytochrome c family protein